MSPPRAVSCLCQPVLRSPREAMSAWPLPAQPLVSLWGPGRQQCPACGHGGASSIFAAQEKERTVPAPVSGACGHAAPRKAQSAWSGAAGQVVCVEGGQGPGLCWEWAWTQLHPDPAPPFRRCPAFLSVDYAAQRG